MKAVFTCTFSNRSDQDVYTLSNASDEQVIYPFVMEILSTKITLVRFATAFLLPKEISLLIKISVVISFDLKNYDLPVWYRDWDGVLNFENGVLVDLD